MNALDPSRSSSSDLPSGYLARPAAQPAIMLSPSLKVDRAHLLRYAIVYVRQSTPQQVLYNKESTDRQYALKDRAIQLGWSPESVQLVDEDLGRSGQSSADRPGFQYLLAEVALNHVGIILGLEMSRLARSNLDWHRLLEVCAVFGTLLADQDGVYDPRDYNDRLLLGLKGAISEAELHLLRKRMHDGLINKARRGEVYNHPPIGYVKSEEGAFALDPDEQARSVVRLVFAQFDRLGTAHAVLRYLAEHDIQLPVRPFYGGPERGQLQWHRPNRVTVHGILEHPIYAGYYRWGYRTVDPRRKVAGHPRSGRTKRPPNECLVLLPNHCPAYISVEHFWSNQERLKANRCGKDTPGAPRRGPSLLGGILFCGNCGYRLAVNYTNAGGGLRYVCARAQVAYGEPECQSLAGNKLDELVGQQVLGALQPAALELHLAAAADVEEQRRQLHEQWQQRLQRAEYEAQRAGRQYDRVEPENRMVAGELEHRWEVALQRQREIKEAYEQFCRNQPAVLSHEDRQQIRALAGDLPALWNAETTTPEDRKRVVRLLVERVVVRVQGKTDQVEVSIHWVGGSVAEHRLVRTVGSYRQMADYARLCGRIDELRAQGKSIEEVACRLNEEGFHPSKRVERFTGGMVWGLLSRRCADESRGRAEELASHVEKGEWLLGELARFLGMPTVTLHRWRKAGWVRARKLPVCGGLWAIWATGPERRRMARLRQFQKVHPNQPIAPELTTPQVPNKP
jgi:DNA invertase Pin-like site-specific DNA recombinase